MTTPRAIYRIGLVAYPIQAWMIAAVALYHLGVRAPSLLPWSIAAGIVLGAVLDAGLVWFWRRAERRQE